MTWSTESFQFELPEIYQLEITNACNLACPACIRADPRVARPIGHMAPALVKTMLSRGDFVNSYFVELQMYGESLLSPYFNEIVGLLKDQNFKIGMSTNGVLLDFKKYDISSLDYLTISIDSPIKKEYEKLRPGASFNNLTKVIDKAVMGDKPRIDLQVIKFPGSRSRLPELVKLSEDMCWDVTCREVPDCFAAYQGRSYPVRQVRELCLNPWLSVSIQWDGDCVSCCFAAGKDNVYGNLYKASLKSIWNNSIVRRNLMVRMMANYSIDRMPCKFCYMRSPVLLHQSILWHNIL